MPTILKTKNSVTTTVVPTTLQQGELAVNITDKKLWVGNAATTPVQIVGSGSGGGGAAGSNTQVQYNSSGALAGSANLTFDGTNLTTDKFTIGTTKLGAGDSSMLKNRIINGAMQVAQYGTGSTTPTASGYYACDRWQVSVSQASKFSIAQSSTAPTGFVNSLLITSASAYSVVSSDFFAIQQVIEGFNASDLGWGTANAKTVTLSFQVYSSLTGTFGGSLSNGAANYSYPFTYSIPTANTWTTISVTIAGPTAGTWVTNNTAGIRVYFGLGVGSTYSGTAGSWSGNYYISATGATSVVGTNGATFYITGVQLEVGTQATGFEYRQFGTELALCQRYFQRVSAFFAIGFNTTTLSGSIAFPQMRASPTISASGALEVSDFFVANYTQSSGNATISGAGSRVSSNGIVADLANFTGTTAGRVFGNLPQINNLVLSSEL
jgi:hypothetical protein